MALIEEFPDAENSIEEFPDPPPSTPYHGKLHIPTIGEQLAPVADFGNRILAPITQPAAQVFRDAGDVARAIPADAAAGMAAAPEFSGNLPQALANIGAPSPRIDKTHKLLPALHPKVESFGEPVQPRQPLPIDAAIDAAGKEAAESDQFPWAKLSADVSQGVAKAVPKLAVLPLAGPTLPAQMAASGLVFGMDDSGHIDPKSALTMGLLPGVGAGIKKATAAAIGEAIARGATVLENPGAQKVLEEIGHQAGLNAYMAAVETPELVQLAQTNPAEFQRHVTEMVANNLGFGLLGAKDWRRAPSQTQQFIERNAELFTQSTLQRMAARELGNVLEGRPSAADQVTPPATQTQEEFLKQEFAQPAKAAAKPIEEFPPIEQTGAGDVRNENPSAAPPVKLPQASDSGFASAPALPTEATPHVPESGTLAAIAAEQPVTAQRTARIEAAKPYTIEQALVDLPNAIRDLKAVLEKNQIAPSATPAKPATPIEELPAETLAVPPGHVAGVDAGKVGALATAAGGEVRPENVPPVENQTSVQAANDASPKQSLANPRTDVRNPNVPEITPESKPKRVGLRARKVFDRETELGHQDILDWMANNMRLLSKKQAKQKGAEWWKQNASLYDDAGPLKRPHHNVIYSETGEYPDQVAEAAYRAGVLKAPDVNELWARIHEASERRTQAFANERKQTAHLETQADWEMSTAKGDLNVRAEELQPGEEFEVDGEKFKVTRVNPDGSVILDDGKRFGRQELAPGKSIWVENPDPEIVDRVAETGPQFSAGGEFTFDAPESVADQKARQAREKQAADDRKAREQMLERSQARLTGKDIDTTPDIFGGVEGRSTRQDKTGQTSLFSSGWDAVEGGGSDGVSLNQARRVVEMMQKEFPKGLPVEVVESEAQLPAEIQDAAKSMGVSGIKGVHSPRARKIYVVAKSMADIADVKRVFLHEQAGHFATNAVLGSKLRSFASDVERSFRDSKIMDQLREDYPGANAITLGQEFIAKLAENPQAAPGAWNRVVAKFKAWLRSVGLKLDVSENDIRVMLAKAMDGLRGGDAESEPGKVAFSATPKGEPTKDWQALKSAKDAAEEALKVANRNAVNPMERRKAGLSVEQAKNQRAVATAEFRRAEEALRESPSYIEHLLRRTKEIVQERNTATDPQHKAELEVEFETLNHELDQVPRKMVDAVMQKKFMTGERRSVSEEQAGSEFPGAERHPADEEASPAEFGSEEAPPEKAPSKLGELPEKVSDAFTAAEKTRQRLGNLWTARHNRDVIAATFDAAENGGNLFGKQAGSEILHELNRSFGATGDRVALRNPIREHALSFVIESGMDPAELREMRTKIKGSAFANKSAGRTALRAIDYAEAHFDALKPVAELYSKITDAQVEHERLAGVDTLHWKGGYVFHMQDAMASQPLLDIGGNGGFGPSSPFLKVRAHATFADAIAAGEQPKSLNAVDLLQRRLALGQKLINHGAWVDGLRRIIDPATQLPLVTETQTHVRADGKEYEAAPPGYSMIDYAGTRFAVLKGGYDKLVQALVTPSTIRNSLVGNVAMEMAGGIKHGMLVFDTYHLGRIAFWNAMVRGGVLLGNPAAYKRGLLLLDQSAPEIRRMVERNEIPAKMGEDLVASKQQLQRLIDNGLNVGGAADNIATHFVQNLPIAGRFNRFLFQEFQRGATAEAALIEYRRQLKMNPGAEVSTIARKVARDLNVRFGNLQSQSWIKNKNVAEILRIFFLAPQWNESLIRSELGAAKELGMAIPDSIRTKRLNVGLLGRAVFTAAIGQFLANQVINYITRGQPTWENPEETETAKISAWIPDLIGNGPGFFLNPLTLPAEVSELLMKKTERSGDFTQALKQYFSSRLGPLGRVPYTLMVREDPMGAKLKTGSEVAGQMLSSLVPVPLPASPIIRGAKQVITGEPEEKFPGQFQRQAFQTFGVKLDSAPSENQRMAALAKEFNAKKGITPSAEFYHGDYYDLDRALQVGNQREAKKAIEELLQKKTPKEVREHYDRWATARFTGKKDRETEFVQTLNAEQRATYTKAQQKRQQIREQVNRLLANQPLNR